MQPTHRAHVIWFFLTQCGGCVHRILERGLVREAEKLNLVRATFAPVRHGTVNDVTTVLRTAHWQFGLG